MKELFLYGLISIVVSLMSCAHRERKAPCPAVRFERMETYYDMDLQLDVAYDDLGPLNACAKAVNKPILTIYGCYACIGYEPGVWIPLADPEVNSLLRESFLIRYYFLDNQDPLPDSLQNESGAKTTGAYFLAKQINTYQVNSQPLYTITDWEEKDLVDPIPYVSRKDLGKFRTFIKQGMANYLKR